MTHVGDSTLGDGFADTAWNWPLSMFSPSGRAAFSLHPAGCSWWNWRASASPATWASIMNGDIDLSFREEASNKLFSALTLGALFSSSCAPLRSRLCCSMQSSKVEILSRCDLRLHVLIPNNNARSAKTLAETPPAIGANIFLCVDELWTGMTLEGTLR